MLNYKNRVTFYLLMICLWSGFSWGMKPGFLVDKKDQKAHLNFATAFAYAQTGMENGYKGTAKMVHGALKAVELNREYNSKEIEASALLVTEKQLECIKTESDIKTNQKYKQYYEAMLGFNKAGNSIKLKNKLIFGLANPIVFGIIDYSSAKEKIKPIVQRKVQKKVRPLKVIIGVLGLTTFAGWGMYLKEKFYSR